jgi:hypothetical protein
MTLLMRVSEYASKSPLYAMTTIVTTVCTSCEVQIRGGNNYLNF